MLRFTLSLLLASLLLAGELSAQAVSIIDNSTPVIGGTTGQCVTRGSGGRVSLAPCTASTSNTPVQLTITGNVLTIDLSNSNQVFNVTIDDNIADVVITGAPVSKASWFVLVTTGNGTGFGITWGDQVLWPSAVDPSVTATLNKRDLYSFIDSTGSGVYMANIAGQNF